MTGKDGTMTATKILFTLLRSEICGNTEAVFTQPLSQDTLNELYALADAHDLAHVVSDALHKHGLLGTDETSKSFLNRQLLAVYRCEQLKHTLGEIASVLEKEKIPYIPLKGAVLRSYYPEEWMRTSCDVDVLVRKDDLDTACTVLSRELGYSNGGIGSHDAQMFTPGGVHVELHYELIEDGRVNLANSLLAKVWDYAVAKGDNAERCTMASEMFYFYHIAHMAKHFESGGCGIRPFMDLWVLDHIDGADRDKQNDLLARGNLLKFADAARKLSQVWFEGAETDTVSQQMEDYVLRGGVYGTLENRITMQQQKKNGRFKYVLSRIFLPYDVIKFQYPILQKHRWMTPVMQVYRWLERLFGGSAKKAIRELRYNQSISSEKADDMRNFLKSIGL